jgi:transposase-like protein
VGWHAAKFRDDDSARRFVEGVLWPSGPVCPRCRQSETVYKLISNPESAHRLAAGIYKCGRCRNRFSVTSDTIFAGSHIALHKWLLAGHLICSAKDGISVLQLQRELQLGSYRSAWSMSRRINWALNCISRLPESEDTIAALLHVKPHSGMPRPGTRRQKAIWVHVDEGLHGAQQEKRSIVDAPRGR